ncbi:MAG: S1C family serine protease [Planctomycetota bacterium]|jgi:hypothetical protein
MRKVVMILAVFFMASGLLYAQDPEERYAPAQEQEERRLYLGIMLDMEPLPELITKHLGLEPEQGIRISNVAAGSPADEAGLERDDIIIVFQDMQIHNNEELVEAVRNSEIGQKATLLVIHLGKRKEIALTLGQLEGEVHWKYPTDPDFMQSWRPGRMFRRPPDAEEWEQFDIVMPELERGLQEQLRENYFFRHDEASMTVSIEGNPHDENSTVIIKTGDKELETRMGQVHELPEEIRRYVIEDREIAIRNSQQRRQGRRRYTFEFDMPDGRPEGLPEFGPDFERFFEEHYRPQMEREREELDRYRQEIEHRRRESEPWFGPGQEMLERIEVQMRELHHRLEELEMQNRELLERLERDRGEGPAEHNERGELAPDYEHEEYEYEEDFEGEHEENEDPDAVEGEGI